MILRTILRSGANLRVVVLAEIITNKCSNQNQGQTTQKSHNTTVGLWTNLVRNNLKRSHMHKSQQSGDPQSSGLETKEEEEKKKKKRKEEEEEEEKKKKKKKKKEEEEEENEKEGGRTGRGKGRSGGGKGRGG